MGKKKWVKKTIIVTLMLLLGCGMCFYLGTEKYGDSLSEKRRKFYNEVHSLAFDRSMLPSFLVFSPIISRPGEDTSISFEEKYWKTFDELIEKDEQWVPPSEINLPLRGLTELELKRKADKGDAEACLEFICKTRMWEDMYLLTERYLQTAVKEGRPGCEFLWEACKRCLYDPKGFNTLKKEPSYSVFLEQMKQGDTRLFRALLACGEIFEEMEWIFLIEEARTVIEEALEIKLAAGDVMAGKAWADVFFIEGYSWAYKAIQEREVIMKLLGTSVEEFLKRVHMEIYAKSEILDKAVLAEERLYKAAVAGDGEARFLWLYNFGIGFYSKEKWDHKEKWTREIMAAGYSGKNTPYNHMHQSGMGQAYHMEIASYMESVETNNLAKQYMLYMLHRGNLLENQLYIREKGVEEYRNLMPYFSEMEFSGIIPSRYAYGGFDIDLPETKTWIRELAKKGNLLAAFKVMTISEEQGNMEGVYELAYEIARSSWEFWEGRQMPSYPRFERELKDYGKDGCLKRIFDRAASWDPRESLFFRMCYYGVISDLSEEDSAWLSQVLENRITLGEVDRAKKGMLCFFQGRILEKGIGVQVDYARALSYYQEAAEHLQAVGITQRNINWCFLGKSL